MGTKCPTKPNNCALRKLKCRFTLVVRSLVRHFVKGQANHEFESWNLTFANRSHVKYEFTNTKKLVNRLARIVKYSLAATFPTITDMMNNYRHRNGSIATSKEDTIVFGLRVQYLSLSLLSMVSRASILDWFFYVYVNNLLSVPEHCEAAGYVNKSKL